MDIRIQNILELEEEERFEEAYHAYELLDYLDNFEHWKFYYFFLWYVNVEDLTLGTFKVVEKYKLDIKLKEIADVGFEKFFNNAEFKFVAGYTISLFPYYFGDYVEWETRGNELLKAAHEKEPSNIIFELAFKGSSFGSTEHYDEIKRKASEIVQTTFSGNGLLNSYFEDVMGTK